MRRTKYRNVKTEVDGIRFDSKAEAERYKQLRALERHGEIRDLRLQPRFSLRIGENRICTYVADFEYWLPDGSHRVEDVKGHPTQLYKLKKRLFEVLYQEPIFEWHARSGQTLDGGLK